MRPEEPFPWRVHILFGVRKAVVVTVVSGPPERAHLRRRGADPGQDELKGPAGAESPVGEVTVIPGGDSEHADPDQRQTEGESPPGETDPKHEQASQMDRDKGKTPKECDFRIFTGRLIRLRMREWRGRHSNSVPFLQPFAGSHEFFGWPLASQTTLAMAGGFRCKMENLLPFPEGLGPSKARVIYR